MKRMIFHVPYFVDENMKSGSHIRPPQMRDAFVNLGYQVDSVMGYGQDRKKAIQTIKNNIRNGVSYDFCYTESSTMPTLLTEKNHLPRYPFLDFGFFRFLKQNGIKIGLFYRDCYWAFEHISEGVSSFKKMVSKFFYRYDLKQYNRWLDVFYLPTVLMHDYLPIPFHGKVEPLPPGLEPLMNPPMVESDPCFLKLFYVGGISNLYDLKLLVQTVSQLPNVLLTMCVREKEWEAIKPQYESLMSKNILVIHKSGEAYLEDVLSADLCVLYVKPSEYRKFAMPVKLFEYLRYYKPILSVSGTAVGEFVQRENVGWVVDYDADQLREFLKNLKENRQLVTEKQQNVKDAIQSNTWQARARKVSQDLS